ncbi:hypothetical protein BDY24DRAFT_404560 [Mrakia frigida]|uniref:uncharacterized protein n=1 Tax=Mrakia frigida TaxID=29902 RepID=UPI003FCC0B7C
MASNSYGAGGWGSDDDDDVVLQKPKGRANEGRGGGGGGAGSSRGAGWSRSYPQSRDEYPSSSRPAGGRDGPSRNDRWNANEQEMEQYRQQHQDRRFQRRSPPPPSSQPSHSTSSHPRRRSRSPPNRPTTYPQPDQDRHAPHTKPNRRRRERSSSPLDGSPPLTNPPPSSSFQPSIHAVASTSNYQPKDYSPPPPRNPSRTDISSNQQPLSHVQRVTVSPFSISSHSQTVSPPSASQYSPTFHCEGDTTPAPQSYKPSSSSSSSRPLQANSVASSSSRPVPPPHPKPSSVPATRKRNPKPVKDLSENESDVEAPVRKPHGSEEEDFDEIDSESEGEVIDLKGKSARVPIEDDEEDSGPDVDSDEEVQVIEPTPKPTSQPKSTATAPPPRRPPPPPSQPTRATTSSSAVSISSNLPSNSPNPHDIKSASLSNPDSRFQPPPPPFARPPLNNSKTNPFARNQPNNHLIDSNAGRSLPRDWIVQPPPPRESFGGPKTAQQLAAVFNLGGMRFQQQQFVQGQPMQNWGGGGMMMPPGAGFVPLQQQSFFPHQQHPPPTLGNRTPSYGSQGNQTPRGAGASNGGSAAKIEWIELDANGAVVGGDGSMSPGSGGGSVRGAGGQGGSMSPPQDGSIRQINAQAQQRRSTSTEVKLQRRPIDSYPRMSPEKEVEYKERKARCIELLKMVPGPDGIRSLRADEVERVTWYLGTVNQGLQEKRDVDGDPYVSSKTCTDFFKGLMSRTEYNGFKAARKEVEFLLELQEKRSQIPLGMPPREAKKMQTLLEEIRPRLALLEDLISLRHPIFKSPPPVPQGTVLRAEWDAAVAKSKRKGADAGASREAERPKEKGKERATE